MIEKGRFYFFKTDVIMLGEQLEDAAEDDSICDALSIREVLEDDWGACYSTDDDLIAALLGHSLMSECCNGDISYCTDEFIVNCMALIMYFLGTGVTNNVASSYLA